MARRAGRRVADCYFLAGSLLDPYLEFQRKQLALVQNYRYPHQVGEALFGRLRPDIVRQNIIILEGLESGRIRSWERLVEMQTAFYELFSGQS